MTLQDIFDQLSYGELSQVFIGEGGPAAEGIPEAKRKAVLAHVRLGLTELHKRFLLRERTLTVDLIDGKQVYVLDSRYAESNTASNEAQKYIKDAGDPFQDDLFRVERVYDADGSEIPLNELDNASSIRTTSYNTLLLPDALDTASLKVVYRADHAPMKAIYAESAAFKIPIYLPATHLRALLLFVASRVHTPIGMVSEFHDGNNYMAQFEAEIQQLKDLNYQITSDNSDSRFEDRGFV